MPRQLSVEVLPKRSVTALVYPAAAHGRAGVTLILGPGAGAGQTSAFIVEFATGLAARGIDAVTFNFLYGEAGRRIPEPNDRLEACYRAVIAAVRQQMLSSKGRLAIGGKSMGGRIASQVAAADIGELGIGLSRLSAASSRQSRTSARRASARRQCANAVRSRFTRRVWHPR